MRNPCVPLLFLAGDIAVVGAFTADLPGLSDAGAAVVRGEVELRDQAWDRSWAPLPRAAKERIRRRGR